MSYLLTGVALSILGVCFAAVSMSQRQRQPLGLVLSIAGLVLAVVGLTLVIVARTL